MLLQTTTGVEKVTGCFITEQVHTFVAIVFFWKNGYLYDALLDKEIV